MKKILAFILSIATVSGLKAQKEPAFLEKSFAAESITSVKSETSGGNIIVKSITSGEAKVEVFVKPANQRRAGSTSREEIKQKLEEDYDLTVTVSNGLLTATARSKKKVYDWKDALSISFNIYVPAKVSTNLLTSGGNIELSDLAGTQDFKTSGGNLKIERVKGKVNGRTSGGNISIVDSYDDIRLTTSGGNITADQCKGKLHLVTSGGSIELKDLNGEVDAGTSGGNIEGNSIKGELQAHTSGGNVHLDELYCSVESSTSGGNIDISITEPGKYVRVNNSGGNIDIELPSAKGMDIKLTASKIKTDKLSNFSGSLEDDKIEGALNGGGIPVTVRASSGRITLSLK